VKPLKSLYRRFQKRNRSRCFIPDALILTFSPREKRSLPLGRERPG